MAATSTRGMVDSIYLSYQNNIPTSFNLRYIYYSLIAITVNSEDQYEIMGLCEISHYNYDDKLEELSHIMITDLLKNYRGALLLV